MSTPASRRCGADRYQLFLAIEREAKPPQLPAARPDEYEKPIGIIELEVFWRGLGEAKFGVGQGHVGYMMKKLGYSPNMYPSFGGSLWSGLTQAGGQNPWESTTFVVQGGLA